MIHGMKAVCNNECLKCTKICANIEEDTAKCHRKYKLYS